MNEIISVSQLGITRQGTTILSDINFTMNQSQHIAIIGPNGAGKSFFLRVLSADLIPSSGTVTLLGGTFGKTNLWDLRRRIGFVSSRLAFWYEANSTAADVVYSGFFGTYGVSEEVSDEQKERAHQMLSFFGMGSFTERLFETLSDGERRKILLARAMVTEPDLLIFDEPCQGLDIPSRDIFLEDVDRLAQKTPIIYVSHHPEELPSCISEVLYLKSGKIFKFGPKEEMITTENMSALFDYELEVVKKGDRFYVQHR